MISIIISAKNIFRKMRKKKLYLNRHLFKYFSENMYKYFNLFKYSLICRNWCQCLTV